MPRYEVRNTANNELSYLTADPSFDLAALMPDGSYRVRAMSDETAEIVVNNGAPAISSLSPADGATNVAIAVNLVMTFNRAMARQGTVDLRVVGGSLIESFDLATEGTWSAGDTVWTGNPAADFTNDASLCVRWSGLEDTLSNAIANNTGDTLWNFTVEPAPAAAITATYLSTVIGDWTPNFGTLDAGWYAVLMTQRNSNAASSIDSITPPGQSAVLPIEQVKGTYNTGAVMSAIFFVELTAQRSGDWAMALTTDGFAVQNMISIYSLSAEPAIPLAGEKATRAALSTDRNLLVNTIAGNDVIVLSSILDAVEPTDSGSDIVTRDSSSLTNTSVRQQTFSGSAAGGTPETVFIHTVLNPAFQAHSHIAIALKAA